MRFVLLILLMLPRITSAFENCTVPDMSQITSFTEEVKTITDNEELITIHKESYERNLDATFCIRPVEMLDTLVIHHSMTLSTATPQDINDIHLNAGTATDPWYMIAYGYVINSPYQGNTSPEPKVTEGRPIELVGASTGTNAWVKMTPEQKKYWDEGKVVCGKEGKEFKVNPKMVSNGKIKANVTTLGIVINGNYAKYNSRSNTGGYRANSPRIPSDETIDMTARLSCQLQKKHPNIKMLRWHSYFTQTSCPGIIKEYIAQIKSKAKEYGCEFY